MNATVLSETLWVIGLGESAGKGKVSVRKKTMNQCVCESEECERGVGASATVNATVLSETLYQ